MFSENADVSAGALLAVLAALSQILVRQGWCIRIARGVAGSSVCEVLGTPLAGEPSCTPQAQAHGLASNEQHMFFL